MEENRYEKIEGAVPAPKLSKSEWWDNFWYYHKWHVVVAIFVIIAITITTCQFITRTKYDIHIVYAGDYAFARTSEGSESPSHNTAMSSLGRVAGDIDGNGDVSVAFKDLLILSDEKMNSSDIDSQTYSRVIQDRSQLNNVLVETYDSFYILFLSKEVYEANRVINKTNIFDDLCAYAGREGAVLTENHDAVYLSSIGARILPGLSELPEDTVIVIKSVSDLAAHWDENGSKKAHDDALAVLLRLIDYK